MPKKKSGVKTGDKATVQLYRERGWLLPTYDPRRGKGPPKGSGGRPPDSIKIFLEGLRDHPQFRARLRELALSDPDPDRARRFAVFLLDRTEGKPVQPIAHVDPGLDALKEMPNDRFLEYVRRLEAEVAVARRAGAGSQARQG